MKDWDRIEAELGTLVPGGVASGRKPLPEPGEVAALLKSDDAIMKHIEEALRSPESRQ